MIKIVTIIGARPQFVKACVVSKSFSESKKIDEIIVHTGQHFDENMSSVFFDQLNIPKPKYQLNINSLSHGEMTGKMLIEIEKILIQEKPDYVLVYGDTNSTLAGSLAASKLHIKIIHIEAGLRSFNMKMPEEINRILTDNLSSILFCPTTTAIENLKKEGFSEKTSQVILVGDVMQDSTMLFSTKESDPKINGLKDEFVLLTLHREENTNDINKFKEILDAVEYIHQNIIQVVFPIHPRTKKLISQIKPNLNCLIAEPLGYLEMLWMLKRSKLILTDSGGVQKEAYFFSKPCVTLRNETEWVELVENDANILVGSDYNTIIKGVENSLNNKISDTNLYGGGEASNKITSFILNKNEIK